MLKRALVFPGQGSQYSGMGRELAEAFPEARATLEEADERLGMALSRLCFEGPEEELRLTRNTQPAILAISVAVFRCLRSQSLSFDFVAGHSLGEYSAVVAAGGLSFGDALESVRARGQFMQEAVPVGEGAMAAVLGLEQCVIEEICSRVQQETGECVAPANLNSPGQIVIAGSSRGVALASQGCQEAGARRAVELPVSAPFHCALMRPAQERLARVLRGLEFRDLEVPLINNVAARAVRSAEEVREGLVQQVSSTVRWVESVQAMIAAGVGEFIEVGPGTVLAGLIRKINRDVAVISIEKPEQVERYVPA